MASKHSGKKVYLTLKAIEKIVIKVEFNDAKDAKEFLEFVKSPPDYFNYITQQ